MTDSARRTIRTIIQTGLSAAAGLPLIVHASGVPETTAGVGVLLAVAAGLTRVMALPVVDSLLPSWLRKNAPVAPVAPVPPSSPTVA